MEYYVFGGVILSIFILLYIIRYRKNIKILKELREGWGKPSKQNRSLESVQIYFDLIKNKSVYNSYIIDDDTWHDLDFDEIFAKANRTSSITGSQYLYYLLRHPVLKKEKLDEREKLVNDFTKNSSLREKVQMELESFEQSDLEYLPCLLWNQLLDKPFYANLLPILSLLSTAVLILVITGYLHLIYVMGIFIMNLFIRLFVKRNIDENIYSFTSLGALVRTASNLSMLKFPEFKKTAELLKAYLINTKNLSKTISAMTTDDGMGITEYLNFYFLWDISGFYMALNKIKNHIGELRKMYETIGSLDALISVASFRLSLKDSCSPIFTSQLNKFKVTDISNPLLEQPVSNSFEFISKNNIVTGSNMAGKTTFLKTIGVNAILAQTINTVAAKTYEAPFIKVISSISRDDNLVLGKSYYMAEVESILRLINDSKSDATHLFILDEIYRGTNSVERLAASVAVLDYLANGKNFILAATHDLHLSDLMKEKYVNYHFQETVTDDGLTFDYKLQSGISTTRNAIALLKYAGYPQSIIDNANSHVRNSEE